MKYLYYIVFYPFLFADTFEETKRSLESLGFGLESQTTEKFSKAAAAKLKSSAASSSIKSAMMTNSLVFTDDDDTDGDETVGPVKELCQQIKSLQSTNAKLEASVERLTKELSSSKQESTKLEDKLNKTKEKYRNVKAEFKTARELNYDLQRKLIDSINPNDPESDSIPILESEPSSPSLLSSLNRKKKSSISFSSQPHKILKLDNIVDNIMPITENSQNELFSTSLISATEDDVAGFNLTDEIIKSSGLGCRFGKDGDKVYVKNLAINLFGTDTLRNSSVTGRKPPTGGLPPRPSLPKAGIVYIQQLLTHRVLKELSADLGLNEEGKRSILNERTSSVVVVQAIGDKIATLRRVKK